MWLSWLFQLCVLDGIHKLLRDFSRTTILLVVEMLHMYILLMVFILGTN